MCPLIYHMLWHTMLQTEAYSRFQLLYIYTKLSYIQFSQFIWVYLSTIHCNTNQTKWHIQQFSKIYDRITDIIWLFNEKSKNINFKSAQFYSLNYCYSFMTNVNSVSHSMTVLILFCNRINETFGFILSLKKLLWNYYLTPLYLCYFSHFLHFLKNICLYFVTGPF